MIPLAHITQWRNIVPWTDSMQVEQDLILSRVLIDIFSDPFLKQELAFRGGTALHKLFFDPPARYSEDIDLVRTSTGPISPIVDALRLHINSWLGEPKIESKNNSFKLKYCFNPEGLLNVKPQKIKIEINTREHANCFKRIEKRFIVQSDWFTGEAHIHTFQFEELIATKLRALYQRKKGRDIFDIWLAIKHENFDVKKIVEAFEFYMKREGNIIKRDDFIKNIEEKLESPSFMGDIGVLLAPNLKKTHSSYLTTQGRKALVAENETFLMTEGWSLQDAVEEIKGKVLMHLPQ
jgi:predicted nucleotidyltransferase component of viral defense system